MNLTRPSEIRALLTEMDFAPSRVLGQNFLTDGNILRIILDTADLQTNDHILEIGPGLGVLTEAFLQTTCRVTAIEKDKKLCQRLRETLGEKPNLTLLEGDALDINFNEILETGITKIISNLPYSVGNRVMIDAIMSSPTPDFFLVMVQKDVADRMRAKSGNKTYGLLSVFLQAQYEVQYIHTVSRGCFYPPPHISSSLVLLKKKPENLSPATKKTLLHTLRTCFAKRRKQIGTIFQQDAGIWNVQPNAAIDLLQRAGIEPTTRPEAVPVVQWISLCKEIQKI